MKESTLNRIEHWVFSKDIAGISAFRSRLRDITEKTFMDIELGGLYNKPLNIRRNMVLKSSLLKMGYGVTKIAGSYIEGGDTEVQEESYVVVNLKDDSDFKSNIFKLSEYFNQDSFLFKSKNDINAYIIGTNLSDFPGYKNEINQGLFHKKVNAKYMSRLKSQGFAFSKNDSNNPILPHKPYTFDDRKQKRKLEKNIDLNEIFYIFEIETFDELQNNSKHLCDIYSKDIVKKLKD